VLAAKTETWRAGTRMLGGEISTRLTGRVIEMEHQPNGRVRLTIDVIATEDPMLRYAPERVRVSARTVPAGVRSGTVVSGVARLQPPTGPVRPGSYDFSFESYFNGIGASGFFLSGPAPVDPPAPPTLAARFSAAVKNARATLAGRIRDRIGGVEGEIAAALVVGVRAGIPESVNEAMRRSGLAHILSISGLHMALVAATIMAALRGGMALFPEFSSRRPVKKYAAFISLVAIAAYLFISGGEVAAQRSFIMLAVMLTAVIFDRAALSMRNLAIATILVVAWSPHEAVGPSFQMSFAATVALIGAYSAWSERRRRPGGPPRGAFPFRVARKGLSHVTGLVMTSLIAGAATTLYGAYHFQRVSPLSLGANLAAMPAVSGIVMPFAVMGMVAMPFGLDGPFFDIMGKGITAMIAVAEWFSQRSPIDGVCIIPPAAVVILTVALVVATLFTTWLRLAAVPLLALGLLSIAGREIPDVLISEDGRVVALRLDDGAACGGPRSAECVRHAKLAAGAQNRTDRTAQTAAVFDGGERRRRGAVLLRRWSLYRHEQRWHGGGPRRWRSNRKKSLPDCHGHRHRRCRRRQPLHRARSNRHYPARSGASRKRGGVFRERGFRYHGQFCCPRTLPPVAQAAKVFARRPRPAALSSCEGNEKRDRNRLNNKWLNSFVDLFGSQHRTSKPVPSARRTSPSSRQGLSHMIFCED
jgi:competence protein ComEC